MATAVTGLGARRPLVGGALLFVLALPLLPTVFIHLNRGRLGAAVAAVVTLGLLWSAAYALRLGIGNARRTPGERRRWPFKSTAAVLCAAGTGLAAHVLVGHPLWIAAGFALAAFAGAAMAYGLDRPGPRPDLRQRDMADALAEARADVEAIEAAARTMRGEIRERLERITARTRAVIERVEADPKDLRRARKFLKVYLEGTRRVVERYARMNEEDGRAELGESFREVLATIERVLDEQLRKLAEHDVLDLDVQIEVLQTQLEREGIV